MNYKNIINVNINNKYNLYNIYTLINKGSSIML